MKHNIIILLLGILLPLSAMADNTLSSQIAIGGNQATLKSFHAYFVFPKSENVRKVVLHINNTTAISKTSLNKDFKTVNVYNIQGVLVKKGVEVAKALEGLPKGIYVYNGKKYVVK